MARAAAISKAFSAWRCHQLKQFHDSNLIRVCSFVDHLSPIYAVLGPSRWRKQQPNYVSGTGIPEVLRACSICRQPGPANVLPAPSGRV